MCGDLSHGLPPLSTSGNRILRTDTMRPVLLRGVNRSGLEYSEPGQDGFLAGAAFSAIEVREIVREWRAGVIRVPFNQDWALRGRGPHSSADYLSALDRVIEWAAALGAYTILDLQWLDADTVYGHASGRPNHVAPAPNPDSLTLWATLAARYRDEPAVLFDIFNEPHDRIADDYSIIHVIDRNGDAIQSNADFVGPEEWVPWAARLVGEIRSLHPDSLIFVSGVDWAFDLRSVEIDAPNIVYSTHIYANRPQTVWWKAFGRAASVPVFVGEWGGEDQHLAFGRDLLNAIRQYAAGWTAWSWVDYPPLVHAPRAPDYRPTAFGELVRDELRVGPPEAQTAATD